jgi:hypothetical protein
VPSAVVPGVNETPLESVIVPMVSLNWPTGTASGLDGWP